jgi:hypothetical protein
MTQGAIMSIVDLVLLAPGDILVVCREAQRDVEWEASAQDYPRTACRRGADR